uniref:Uncharacterized protein n=1 Tax=Tanacetum cinerariifolium TaxID=118510 RepID=A0A699T818_TANCI|nr:hypothetical protein [Tanacetum cinerariifolium]
MGVDELFGVVNAECRVVRVVYVERKVIWNRRREAFRHQRGGRVEDCPRVIRSRARGDEARQKNAAWLRRLGRFLFRGSRESSRQCVLASRASRLVAEELEGSVLRMCVLLGSWTV